MTTPQLKPIQEWTIDFIRQLPASECEWLDFKDSRWILSDKIDESLSKYVSAFSNYGGGYLIIGCNDPKPDRPIEPDSGVDFAIKGGVQGWLEDKIHALVDPPASRIGVHLIPVEVGTNRGVVIIRIEPSQDAPHQAKDKIFYQRVGSKLKGLGTQHIHDIRNRQQHPDIIVTLELNVWEYDDKKDPSSNLMWTVENTSNVFCRHFGLHIKAPISLNGTAVGYSDPHYMDTDPDDETRRCFKVTVNNPLNSPLFPKAKLKGNIPVTYGGRWDPPHETSGEIKVVAYADAAPPKIFTFSQFDIAKVRMHPRVRG